MDPLSLRARCTLVLLAIILGMPRGSANDELHFAMGLQSNLRGISSSQEVNLLKTLAAEAAPQDKSAAATSLPIEPNAAPRVHQAAKSSNEDICLGESTKLFVRALLRLSTGGSVADAADIWAQNGAGICLAALNPKNRFRKQCKWVLDGLRGGKRRTCTQGYENLLRLLVSPQVDSREAAWKLFAELLPKLHEARIDLEVDLLPLCSGLAPLPHPARALTGHTSTDPPALSFANISIAWHSSTISRPCLVRMAADDRNPIGVRLTPLVAALFMGHSKALEFLGQNRYCAAIRKPNTGAPAWMHAQGAPSPLVRISQHFSCCNSQLYCDVSALTLTTMVLA